MEINNILPTDAPTQSLVEMHSALNLLNALLGEVHVYGHLLGVSPEAVSETEARVGEVGRQLRDSTATFDTIESLPAFSEAIRRDLRNIRAAVKSAEAPLPEAIAQEENIEALLEIFAVRAAELLARRDGEGWQEFTLDQLRRSLYQVLDVMQRLSTTSPPIVYDKADHDETNHLFTFDACSVDLDRVTLPAVFQDVIRDLVANARKYTQPGGQYSVEVCEASDAMTIEVRDNGRGIPQDEVERTVEFGYRASNVRERRTLGGGFGLTKAYLATRRHGGRFFIDSVPDSGTTVRIELPLTASRRRTA